MKIFQKTILAFAVIFALPSFGQTKTYSKNGISFQYPSNFIIVYELEKDGGHTLLCQGQGDDVSSFISITYFTTQYLLTFDKRTSDYFCIGYLTSTQNDIKTDQMFSFYKEEGGITPKTIGRYKGYSQKFSVNMITKSFGETFTSINGNDFLCVMKGAANWSNLKELDSIIKTITFK